MKAHPFTTLASALAATALLAAASMAHAETDKKAEKPAASKPS